MTRLTVAVLRGGPSSEYEVSLKTGAALLSALPEERYDARDIFIDKRGVWFTRGLPMEPARALFGVDVLVNALHGGVGEDGTIQRIAEQLHIPYVGSRPAPSALSLNKVRAREVLREAGIALPRAVAFSAGNEFTVRDMAGLVFSQFGPPYVVKPASEGSSAGLRLAATVIELPDMIGDVMDEFGAAIIEEYVFGDEAVVGLIQDFREQSVYALPPALAERPEGHAILPYSLRIAGKIRHVVPSPFSHNEKRALEDMARKAHQALKLSHYSSADFILSRRGPVLLELDAQPHIHETSAFYHMLEAVGSSLREFLEHTLLLARRGA